ncbi:CYTH and CHAD domain-containing protein [Winogradskya humida]|uniref:CHAD domain-containing protein n=1 Tax=Winogradskya humida TaxID=113566 RepID=A0ABQ3ZKE3_9ACTN|nr:CYTH and CHAD domain-containing protein [Actinoplanes humidus]GIE18974.1 CHAD domain-containing protein [Actinoplanes humidus]
MQTATETERKYDVPAGFILPDLTGAVASLGEAEVHDLDATYFDTADLRLARNKHTLRRRTGGNDAGWHLKTPGTGSSRKEHQMPLDDENVVPAELTGIVRSIVRTRELKPVARLRTHRIETPLRDGDGRTLALVAQDEVGAETDAGEQRWQELEVELVDGGPELLDAVEELLRAAGATPAAGPSKLARALDDRLRKINRKPKKLNPVLGYAREQRDTIAEQDAAVREVEPEAVHKMRVATRRLRSTLKTFKASFNQERAEPLKDELKWLADSLGAVRDAQVLSQKLGRAAEPFPTVAQELRDRFAIAVEQGKQQLHTDLDSDRYLALLDAIDDLVDDAVTKGIEDAGALGRAAKALRKADQLLDEATADDGELHEARKKYKQARYAVEVFAEDAGKPGRQLVKGLTELQDVLGAHQDSVVAREVLQDAAWERPNAFDYGILFARQEQVGEETRLGLSEVTEKSRKGSLRAWLS